MQTVSSAMSGSSREAVRRAQIEDCTRFARIAVVGTLFNLAVTIASVWSWHYVKEILAWAVLVSCATLARLVVARRTRAAPIDQLDIAAIENEVVVLALVNGLTWGAGTLAASFMLGPAQFGIVCVLIGGMMGAAVMTYGTMPRAAMAYIVSVAAGGAGAFAFSPNANFGALLLLTSYIVVLKRTIGAHQANFIAKIETQTSLRESAATVRLLLNDFEQQSADWLWSVDAQGRIVEPGQRFGEACMRDAELLEGVLLASLFDRSRERGILEDRLQAGLAFRGLTLKLTVDAQPRWWTLSASPHDGGGMRGVASDVTAEKRAEARVSYMAHYDGLTDLANRFLFNETLQRLLKRNRGKSQLAVLCLDLDQFKSVNDTLGHPVGDKLLTQVARRLEDALRPSDLVARLGGDEFAIIINRPGSLAAIDACARRIIAGIEQPFMIEGLQVMTSTSIGIAVSGARDVTGAELLKQADLALYAAKSSGRNRYTHFEPGMDEAARERRELEMDLRAALVRDEFELHYQPLVDVETGKTVSYEALVRWNHPERGVVMPSDFIPLAEETGLIVQIGEWVIRNATREVANWPEGLRVSVNVSPAQMRSAHLVGTVINAVANAGIAPSRLELEITENVLMHDSEVNIAILHKLRDFGVRIALDDFGTGYSSLNYLRSFPFDKIKIDRCFVENIHTNPDCRAIVRAVTGLASSLGMTTTAEGVENEEQMNELRNHGCTEVQGFLFARPSSAEQFTDLRSSDRRGARAQNGSEITLLPAFAIGPGRESEVSGKVRTKRQVTRQ